MMIMMIVMTAISGKYRLQQRHQSAQGQVHYWSWVLPPRLCFLSRQTFLCPSRGSFPDICCENWMLTRETSPSNFWDLLLTF